MLLNLPACTSIQGSDGHTYYWIKPFPSGDGPAVAAAPSYQTTTYTGTVNGRGFSVTTFARGR